MEQKRLYIDLHVLQTVPPSCLNRDDTEAPKPLFMVALPGPECPLNPGNGRCG